MAGLQKYRITHSKPSPPQGPGSPEYRGLLIVAQNRTCEKPDQHVRQSFIKLYTNALITRIREAKSITEEIRQGGRKDKCIVFTIPSYLPVVPMTLDGT